VGITEISVLASGVEPLRLLTDLLAATADAHTPRAMARALAAGLSRHITLTRLQLEAPDETITVERAGADWQCVDTPSRRTPSVAITPHLSITQPRGARAPALLRDPAVRAALAEVVAALLRHLAVVHRVADVSRRAHATSRDLRADLERATRPPAIVARSPAMRAVVERAALVARHPTTVLVTGESGTGKDVLARELHRLSPRGHRPMLSINCGAIPDTLVEAELFGHERGAFTGADRAHPGVFERAHGSTLFLDEVAELPLAAQAKLLRVLQERQLRRLGGTTVIDVDVRLIAATNRDLEALVGDGRFREDLYYRLNVFGLQLPPLRERTADLPVLVTSLVAELAARLQLPAPPVSRAALARLQAHRWPGNVRELASTLESALILGAGRTLELPAHLGAPRAAGGRPFDAAVRQAIEAALRAASGRIYGPSGAAAALGLAPATLQSKMLKLGITRTTFCM
jgi:transcriptional regulator with GAF, ATPase, and Fis domain